MMLLRSILASGLCGTTAFAFQDTSPFFAFSTTDTLDIPGRQVTTSKQLLESFRTQFSPSDVYIIVSQPGVSADDFQDTDATPYMARYLRGGNKAVSKRTIIPEVIGGLQASDVQEELRTRHGITNLNTIKSSADGKFSCNGLTSDSVTELLGCNDGKCLDCEDGECPFIWNIRLPSLPTSGEERTAQLANHDKFISSAFSALSASGSTTLIYTTTPPSSAIYSAQRPHSVPLLEKSTFDWDFEDAVPDALHIDLKRDTSDHMRKRASSNSTLNEGAPLFEKYNFFSPAIFMGLIVMLLLISIGSVGVKALGGLQVSYAAFSKENGPQGSKKQQQ